MSLETRVGAFVVSGLLLIATAIFLLGNYTLERRYTIYATFHDVANLTKNSPVKLSGVEVGQVKAIELVDSHAKVTMSIRRGVDIYRDADFTVGTTGIIGSKYLQIDQGHREAGVIEPGTTVQGTDPMDMQKALTKALASLQSLMNDLNAPGPRGSLTGNLKETVADLREMTANLNDLIATTKPSLEHAMARADDITAKLDDVLAKTDVTMAALATSSGTVGALLHDEKMKENVSETLASVKEAAGSAKDALSRLNQFRIWWNYDWRYESALRSSKSDLGLKIVPRPGRYYYVGVENFGSQSNVAKHGQDFERINTVDGLLGFERGPFDFAVGSIRSAGGARLTLTPFYTDPIGKRFSVFGQVYDFSRNIVVAGRPLNKPAYDVGILARVNRFFGVGARVEDLAETKRGQVWAKVSFEDQDIAYLFGLATFGAAGSKGRSKNGSSGQ